MAIGEKCEWRIIYVPKKLKEVVADCSASGLESPEKYGETLNMEYRKTERLNWNAANLYQRFLLWKRKGLATGKTSNVREKFFPLSNCHLEVEKKRKDMRDLRRLGVFTQERSTTWMEEFRMP